MKARHHRCTGFSFYQTWEALHLFRQESGNSSGPHHVLDLFDLFFPVTCQNSSEGHWLGQGRAPLFSCLLSALPCAGFMPVTCFLVMCPDHSHTAHLGKQLQEAISNQVTEFWERRKRRIKKMRWRKNKGT